MKLLIALWTLERFGAPILFDHVALHFIPSLTVWGLGMIAIWLLVQLHRFIDALD